IRFFLMMVWSLFIIGLMGLFFYNKIGSIIPMVVLPTTEIIEPLLAGGSFWVSKSFKNFPNRFQVFLAR
ncbi:hypothetical protein, partial [Streptococcus infantis]|uniref:hypothetical protein n=1 Tax=Streptococcus infantis TaxID=68892 RepID=UPI0039C1350F